MLVQQHINPLVGWPGQQGVSSLAFISHDPHHAVPSFQSERVYVLSYRKPCHILWHSVFRTQVRAVLPPSAFI